MSAAYQHLALADLQAGMVLSDDVLDQQGQVLLPKGALLTEATIAHLPAHGIEAVAVLREHDSAASTDSGPDDTAILQRLDHVFRHTDINESDDAVTGLLRMYVTDYRLGRENAP